MEKVRQSTGIEIKKSEKTGCFCSRDVAIGIGFATAAAGTAITYMINPTAALGLGVVTVFGGGVFLYKKLSTDPMTENLEKLKSSDHKKRLDGVKALLQAIESEQQNIDLVELYKSLANINLDDRQGSIITLMDQIKQKLPFEKKFDFLSQELKSRNVDVKIPALKELMSYYDTATPDQTVSIINEIFKSFVDDNDLRFLDQIDFLLVNNKIGSIAKLEAFIAGFVNYFQCLTKRESKNLDGTVQRTLEKAIEFVVSVFIRNYKTICENKNISLTQFHSSLEQLKSSIPNDTYTESLLSKINNVLEMLKPTNSLVPTNRQGSETTLEQDLEVLSNMALK